MKKRIDRLLGGLSMLSESISMSVQNIVKNTMRSFLTILGIMIGVTAVIALVTTISGVSSSITDSFTSMGAGTMTLSAPGNDLKAGLDAKDMADITAMEHVRGVTPTVSLSATVTRSGIVESAVTVSGKNDFYFTNLPGMVERGRAINKLDVDSGGRVCLISADMVDTFFFGINPIGQTLYIANRTFTVIGILSDEADSALTGSTEEIMIPYTTALKLNAQAQTTALTVYLEDKAYSESVTSTLEAFLDALFHYEEDTYTITTMEGIESAMDEMLSMMSMLLGGIASIALLVGGIGIMNMMLTSVTERTVEIGLKKAIGARPRQIQVQFLIESFLLSMVGGLAGVILGLVVSALLCAAMGTNFTVSYGAIALGVGFSAAVGVIFGWSPARKASALSPIEALRRM